MRTPFFRISANWLLMIKLQCALLLAAGIGVSSESLGADSAEIALARLRDGREKIRAIAGKGVIRDGQEEIDFELYCDFLADKIRYDAAVRLSSPVPAILPEVGVADERLQKTIEENQPITTILTKQIWETNGITHWEDLSAGVAIDKRDSSTSMMYVPFDIRAVGIAPSGDIKRMTRFDDVWRIYVTSADVKSYRVDSTFVEIGIEGRVGTAEGERPLVLVMKLDPEKDYAATTTQVYTGIAYHAIGDLPPSMEISTDYKLVSKCWVPKTCSIVEYPGTAHETGRNYSFDWYQVNEAVPAKRFTVKDFALPTAVSVIDNRPDQAVLVETISNETGLSTAGRWNTWPYRITVMVNMLLIVAILMFVVRRVRKRG